MVDDLLRDFADGAQFRVQQHVGLLVKRLAQGEEFAQLYKSLGGGWQNYQSIPPIRRPQPAIQLRRRPPAFRAPAAASRWVWW